MTIVQKWLTGLIGLGVLTTMLLPGRQTVPVIGAVEKLISGPLKTAMTGN